MSKAMAMFVMSDFMTLRSARLSFCMSDTIKRHLPSVTSSSLASGSSKVIKNCGFVQYKSAGVFQFRYTS